MTTHLILTLFYLLIVCAQLEGILYGVILNLLCFLEQGSIGFCHESLADSCLDEWLSAQGILNNIPTAWDILDAKVVWCQLRHPPLFASIQFWFCEDVGEWVVVCPDSKRVSFQPMTEFVAH